ncbi:phospholipase [Amycolatopsis acidiphila]|uniref:Phospholipase n=1 Tax=Amycolatopsis acidiphila TaxID=715473 RepID=A0A558A569_9PSEU|nr:phospholipase [Amycolatopsis acidiphila]TVT19407.1 phospholipase [Amycolatopsis acidiphila]UIJ56785.1 phospholipase [Amycolatopsis acidiphila]GHG55119.1 phospholipase/carboxylesterase [Amycolatopsis acidiphila]
MSNPHLDQQPETAGAPLAGARAAALVVHGRGQTPDYMKAVLDRVALPELAYLLPSAADNTWYPQSFLQPVEQNQPRLDQALETVAVMLGRIAGAGVPPERTFLVGFSQGACLLAEFLVRDPRRYGGAAILTGGYVGPDRRSPNGSLDHMPVFLGTSRHDEWVPPARAEETAELLRAMSADVTFRVYDDREHLVNDDEVAQVRRLLSA